MIGWTLFLVLAGIAGVAVFAWRRSKSSTPPEEDGHDGAARREENWYGKRR